MRMLSWTLLVACLTGLSSGARILAFFPFAATSHHILFEPLTRSLCERGHHVTYLSPNQFKGDVPNLEKIPFQDFWPPIQKTLFEKQENSSRTPYSTTSDLYDAMLELIDASLRVQEVKDVLQSNRQYDAVLTESWFGQESTSVFAHRFNALHIVISTFGGSAWVNEMSGLPDNPSYMYDLRYFKAEHPANFFDRLYSLYITAQMVFVPYWFTMTKAQSLVDELVRYPGWENRPRLTMMASDAALVLRNTHFTTGYPSPTAPHVKDVGGLNVDFDLDKKAQLLDTPKYLKYKAFMDGSNDGFVYFSLGSIVKPDMMLPPGIFEKLYGAFSKLKINVLMRWSGTAKPKTPSPNILLYNEFLPQMEILAHKNIKAFMTHGGLLSICEAINFGVPLVGMPVFGDQPMNVKRAVNHGYGISLSITNPHITESLITTTLSKVLKNLSYKAEAMKRSELFRDRMMRPVEESVYWIEYVLKHGKVLQPASSLMPFYQVYLLDVIATTVVAFLLGLYVIKKSLCWTCSLMWGNKQKTQRQQKNQSTKKKSKKE
uniref:UDP-glucuronosyltransferase 1-5 n=2 Tax=Lygus hesperus TaxID=30085 RepID=A0A0A9Z7Q9_LYGHE